MFWKVFLISLLFTLGILFGLTFILDTQVNRDAINYKSIYGEIDAKTILNHRVAGGDFEVIIISSGCPGRHSFMPMVVEYTELLDARKVPCFLINDDIIGPQSEAELKRFQQELGITDTIYFFDRTTYPNSGGLMRGKLRYRQFVEELCGSNTNFPFGYALCLQFESGQYTGWSFAFPDSTHRENYRQQILEQL